MDITILLIMIIFVLLTVLITGTVIFMLYVFRYAKRAATRADFLSDEQMIIRQDIERIQEEALQSASQRVKQDAVDVEAEEHANRLQEQHAAMMDYMPPGFGGGKK